MCADADAVAAGADAAAGAAAGGAAAGAAGVQDCEDNRGDAHCARGIERRQACAKRQVLREVRRRTRRARKESHSPQLSVTLASNEPAKEVREGARTGHATNDTQLLELTAQKVDLCLELLTTLDTADKLLVGAVRVSEVRDAALEALNVVFCALTDGTLSLAVVGALALELSSAQGSDAAGAGPEGATPSGHDSILGIYHDAADVGVIAGGCY